MDEVATTTSILDGQLKDILNFLAAAAGLGTAAMGVVDASKALWGGPSNFGFGYIKKGLEPFLLALKGSTAFSQMDALFTLKANWLNGVAKADQKATAKSLIHLGLTQDSASDLARAAGVDAELLQSLAQKTATGEPPSEQEINVLGQFDVVLSAVLDAAYERADQKYRNSAKLLAMVASTILGIIGGWLVYGNFDMGYFHTWDFCIATLIGVGATPLAPIVKDLSSALTAAVTATSPLKR